MRLKKLKKYNVEVHKENISYVTIEATSLEEAKKKGIKFVVNHYLFNGPTYRAKAAIAD